MAVGAGFCPTCGAVRREDLNFCGQCGQMFNSPAEAPAKPRREPASFGRILVTPILTVLVGYLIGGMYGLAVGAFIGIVYVLVASSRK